MAYTVPPIESTGTLITAAKWNVLVNDIIFLHARQAVQFISPRFPQGAGSSEVELGDWLAAQLNVGATARVSIHFQVPDDFDTFDSLYLLYVPGTNGTSDFDLSSDYGAAGEAYNNHSETATGEGASVTQNNLYAHDVSGVFSSIADNDYCALQVTHGGTGPVLYILGLLLVYNRE
jgi:hypothetical protein